eukprot:GHVU01110999.1.p1 GENE.GHVU01110999.1~~GHVU01110999.1.p1  ORF type:complete len:227 (-),score=15.28 GHVU01110999.1:453-1133(-)
MAIQIVYNYIKALHEMTVVKQLFEGGRLAIFSDMASLLPSEIELAFYFLCLFTSGHPGMRTAKASIKGTFGAIAISLFPLYIKSRNHIVLCVVHTTEKRILVLDPMPGLMCSDVDQQLAAVFGGTFGWPNLKLERPAMPTQADAVSSHLFVCLYIDFMLRTVSRGLWADQAFRSDPFWEEWDPIQVVPIQQVRRQSILSSSLSPCRHLFISLFVAFSRSPLLTLLH